MANWNGKLLFQDPSGVARLSGAVLPLTGPNKGDGFAIVGSASAEVSDGSGEIMVRFADDLAPEELREAAIPVASAALDILAAEGGPFASIGLRSDTDLVWWTDGGRSARISVHYGLAFRMHAEGIKAVDASGMEIPQPPVPQPVLHESFRYFRLSQCTDVLFDAFRNSYLALESALADLHPKAPGQYEGAWLKDAVLAAQKVAALHIPLGCTPHDAPLRMHDDIYKAVRCPLFHGKAMGLDPGSPEDRTRVLSAYEVVVQCYVLLAGERYHLRSRGGGGLTTAGFASLSNFMDNWTITAGARVDDFIPGEHSELAGGTLPPDPERVLRLGRAIAPFDDALEEVEFIAGWVEGELAFRHPLRGRLYPEGLSTFEVVVDLWNNVDPGYRLEFPG